MTQDIRGIDGVKRIVFIGQFFRRIVLFEFHEGADLLIFGQRIRRFHARFIYLEPYNPTAYTLCQADSVPARSTADVQDR